MAAVGGRCYTAATRPVDVGAGSGPPSGLPGPEPEPKVSRSIDSIATRWFVILLVTWKYCGPWLLVDACSRRSGRVT